MNLVPSHYSDYSDYHITEPQFVLWLFQYSGKEDVIVNNIVYKFRDKSVFYSNYNLDEFLTCVKNRLIHVIKSNQCFIDLNDRLHFTITTGDKTSTILTGTFFELKTILK